MDTSIITGIIAIIFVFTLLFFRKKLITYYLLSIITSIMCAINALVNLCEVAIGQTSLEIGLIWICIMLNMILNSFDASRILDESGLNKI